MDLNETIEKITREVLQKLNGTEFKTGSGSSVSNKNILVILTGSNWRLNEIISFLQKLKTNNRLSFLFSKTAEKIIGYSIIKSNFTESTIISNNENYTAKEIVEQFDLIIAPTMTLTTLTKLANLIGDNLITNVLIQSIISDKTIIVTKDTLFHEGKMPTSFENIITKKLSIIASFGVIVVSIDELQRLNLSALTKSGAYRIGETYTQKLMEQCTVTGLDCSACGLCIVRTPSRVQEIVDSGASRITSSIGVKDVPLNLAKYIDHTLLKPDVNESQIRKLCEEAKEYKFASVCVNPGWVKLCAELLRGTGVKVCTVIGFPLGATSTEAKVAETIQAIKDGADEIDMVINVGALKSKNYDFVREDIRRVKQACGPNIILKVILETCLLTDEEKIKACELSKEAGADFVKTSTGFGSGGATAADIALMRSVVGPTMGVKASGGIRDANIAKEMIRFGATRIGASASVAIVKGEKGKSDY